MMTFAEFLDLQKVKAASGFHKGLGAKDHKVGRDDRGGNHKKNIFQSPYQSPQLHLGPQHLSIDGPVNPTGNTPIRVGKIKVTRSKLPTELSKGAKAV
tara:strand:+ start:23493 stop:23786 length:294 start_codon:yes stop_codon:yes gene_type:complete